MAGSKRQKTTGQASSSGIGSSSGLIPKKWEQPSTVAENDARLYRQDWEWAKFRDSQNARIWDDEKNRQLSSYQDRKLEAKLWKWKMTNGVNTSIPTRVVCERSVNVEEFRKIGIVQMFERLGWESVLDWCEDNTHRIYLSEVCEWLSTLKFVNKNESPSQWKLVGKTSRGNMTMSFETMNRIARFDSLGVQAYDYPSIENFFDNHLNINDMEQLIDVVLPTHPGGDMKKKHMSLEGKILQGISVENILVRFGDRGGVRVSDCRVVHALLYGTPTLSWRHIVMMNTWATRESSQRRFIPYARLISAMLVQQNCLPSEALWVSKPVEEFTWGYMKKNWKVEVKFSGNRYVVTDELGDKFEVRTSGAPPVQEEDVEMEEEEEEEEEAEPSEARRPRQRYMRPHREINAEVAGFVTRRRVPSYKNFDRGQQEIFDNVSACIGEGREYNQRREAWEGSHGSSMLEYWEAQGAQRERMNKFMEEQEMFQAMQRSQMEHLAKMQEDEAARRRAWEEEEAAHRQQEAEANRRRWSAMYVSQQMAINNAKVLHDQERHHRDYLAGLPYTEHSGWTNYPDLPYPQGPSDPTPHWPEAVGSSFIPIPYQPPPQGEQSPLDNYREMFEALTGYPFQPNPPTDPNERYQR
ncbi:hypothetical protein HanHA89_Chr11g0449991 [Helianthus annuus]|nr:hypothetical protein HanHA89_Chr11g0449991 [Helianthus annuus]